MSLTTYYNGRRSWVGQCGPHEFVIHARRGYVLEYKNIEHLARARIAEGRTGVRYFQSELAGKSRCIELASAVSALPEPYLSS